MFYRVRRAFEFHDQKGKPFAAAKGQIVDVLNRLEAQQLHDEGYVVSIEANIHGAKTKIEPAGPRERALRVGVWLRNSTHYSGGRLHVYQYVWNLAGAGAEVFFMSTGCPLWRQDYPERESVHWLVNGEVPPDDLDIAFTDSKGKIGLQAKMYCEDHERCRLVCLNFETENWVAHYAPKIAKNMNRSHTKAGYEASDLLLGNSRLSMVYLQEWMGETADDRRYDWLPPAINTHAVALPSDVPLPERPYAVWSARNTGYKCIDTAIRAVWSLDIPFDLVTFGEPGREPIETDLHKLHNFKNFDDAAKYRLLRHARMLLAPSLFEGFGMTPGEALTVETPAVVFDLPVLREVYGDRLIYVPWNDHDEYVKTAKRVASEPKPDMAEDAAWVADTYGLEAQGQRIERLPFHAQTRRSVEACCICYATPTVCEAIKSVYDHVDKVRVAYGPTKLWQGWPEDGVLDMLKAMPDPDGKIVIEARDVWADKREMREYLARQVEGNRLLVLDADEIWEGLGEWLDAGDTDDAVLFATPRWINLWHGGEHWIHDGEQCNRWGDRLPGIGSTCRHYRYSWWRQSYNWSRHYGPGSVGGGAPWSRDNNRESALKVPDCRIWHLGHAMPRSYMERKHSFYEERDGSPKGRRRAWLDWDGEPGACGDGIVERLDREPPPLVREALQKLQGLT